jgi:hypothetical protein
VGIFRRWGIPGGNTRKSIEASAGVRYAGVSALIMLKIGSVRWRGKCAKHPGFDPAIDGPGAVRGNCQRCNDLVVIHDLHQKALRLMRTFRPMEEKKITLKSGNGDDRQMGLFA